MFYVCFYIISSLLRTYKNVYILYIYTPRRMTGSLMKLFVCFLLRLLRVETNLVGLNNLDKI